MVSSLPLHSDEESASWQQQAAELNRIISLVPRVPLGSFPSTVRRAELSSRSEFWIKDDGVCSEVYSGNKLRKLEYLFAALKSDNYRNLVVMGDVDSHTVEAVGQLGTALGFGVTAVVYVHDRNQSRLPEGIQRLEASGVRIVHCKSFAHAVLKAKQLCLVKRQFYIPLGASTAVANLGFVRAALELLDQVQDGALPLPRRIYLPFATGGTVAGLLVGLGLSNAPIQVVAVQTVGGIIANRRKLQRFITEMLDLLDVPRSKLSCCMSRLEMIERSYLGRGYRDVTPEIHNSTKHAESLGLQLENVFSGKAYAAASERARQQPQLHILFWNTHSRSR